MGAAHSRKRHARKHDRKAAKLDKARDAAEAAARRLTFLHFNDVYNIEPSTREPVGGAARLAYLVKSMADENPMVVFSGDAFSPSLLSVVTLGAQMPPCLNKIGVKVACIGNHDLDFGTAQMVKLTQECTFPWLMSNVLDAKTGRPFANTITTHLMDWNGVRVGFVGLIEGEWLETLGAVDPEELLYVDFVQEGHRLAAYLKGQGAEVLVAITHMRVPNDRKLAAECPEFDIIMGGHDHHYETAFIGPVLMVKSGTDFRNLTKVDVVMPVDPIQKISLTWKRLTVDSRIPEDPEVKQIVDSYMGKMADRMQEVIGYTTTDLDGRFQTVRTAESNLGNFVCDILRLSMEADVCLINGGSFRSDAIHPAGPFTLGDLSAILPMMDPTVVVQATGQQLLACLENSVSMYPKLEGRFCQVSGISFKFDPSQPADNRIVPESVRIGSDPLHLQRSYRLLTKTYMTEGRDGFDTLTACRVLTSEDNSVTLPTTVRNHFRYLQGLSLFDPRVKAVQAARRWRAAAGVSASGVNGAQTHNGVGTEVLHGIPGGPHKESDDSNVDPANQSKPSRYHVRDGEENGLCVLGDGHFCIGPVVNNRIVAVDNSQLEAIHRAGKALP